MARKGENIYKRKDGRWEGRILQEDGKYRSFYAKTYRDVRAKLKYITQQNEPIPADATNFCVNAATLFEDWLTGELRSRLKPSTYESYYCCMQKYVFPYFKTAKNETLSEESIQCFLKTMNENTSLSKMYCKKLLSIFKTALRDISQIHPEFAHLVQYVILPKASSQKSIPVFSVKEQRAIEYTMQCSEDDRVFGLMLCFYTGIRIGELCALKWVDFDLEAGVMSISRTVSRIQNFEESDTKTHLHVGSPKSKTSQRKIPLPEFLLKLAKERNFDTMNENHYILSGTGMPFDPRMYQRFYKRILVNANVPDRKFHSIRHTFATRALELGVDIKTLSEILGHSNVNITLNIYAHSLMEQKKIAIQKFNDMHIMRMKIAECAVNSVVIPTKIAL